MFPANRFVWKRWAIFGLIGASLLLVLVWAVGDVVARRAKVELVQRSDAAATLHSAVLRSELEKFRLLPIVLTEDHDVRETLKSRDANRFARLNAKLEGLSERTRASVIYVLNPKGMTIAASNWRRPDSFVSMDYSYRPYFRDAVAGRVAEHFALGAMSGRPGLFFAQRVETGGQVLGVVVVKVEFDHLEDEWQGSDSPAFVTGPDDVVLLTSVPAWRFHTLRRLSEAERARLRGTKQYGQSPLDPLPFKPAAPHTVTIEVAGKSQNYMPSTAPTAMPDWTLHLLTPANGAVNANSARWLAFLAGVILLLAAGMLLRRRERAAVKAAAEEQARAQLEARVQERTRELSISNDRLVNEMSERRRVEISRQVLQDELVQASKLAALGQIAAGVAHEVNQPVAAIRSFADNAGTLMDRKEFAEARENIDIIAGLTERIGLITNELRAFARKTAARPQPIDVDGAIAGAILLVGHRARELGVTLVRPETVQAVTVMAERVRLEQVLVNLLQNAIEALAGAPGGKVIIDVQVAGRQVRISVRDNGPGLPAEVIANLFTPFVTTKTSGLGLGLVISRDLVAEFGGELTLKDSDASGAMFVISLKKAA